MKLCSDRLYIIYLTIVFLQEQCFIYSSIVLLTTIVIEIAQSNVSGCQDVFEWFNSSSFIAVFELEQALLKI